MLQPDSETGGSEEDLANYVRFKNVGGTLNIESAYSLGKICSFKPGKRFPYYWLSASGAELIGAVDLPNSIELTIESFDPDLSLLNGFISSSIHWLTIRGDFGSDGDESKLRRLSAVGFEAIQRCTSLKGLELYCEFTDSDLQALRWLPELEVMVLAGCSVSGSGLKGDFPNLRQFVSCHDFTDEGVKQLRNFPELEEIQLRGAHITNAALPWLADLKKITRLDLEDLNITEAALASIVKTSVRILVLPARFKLSDVGIESISKFRQLERFGELERPFGTDEFYRMGADIKISSNGYARIACAPSLKTLTLLSGDIDDLQALAIAHLSTLTDFCLSSSNISNIGLSFLYEGLVNLESLHLKEVHLDSSSIKALSKLTKLRRLILQECELTDSDVMALRGMPLKVLKLWSLNLTDAALAIIRDFDTLEELSLKDNAMTSAGLPYLSQLSNLRKLDLSGTKVSCHNLKLLFLLPELEELDLSSTCIDDSILEELSDELGERIESSVRELKIDWTDISYDVYYDLKSDFWIEHECYRMIDD
jgi:Leucine-rich repeat (LRR) protein